MCPGEEAVAAYIAGTLSRDDRDVFESHVDTCTACQELIAALAKSAVPRPPAPASSPGIASPSSALGVASTPSSLGVASTPALAGGAEASFAPGRQLGRYVLLGQLGAGGMGFVLAAYDPELDRKVALKLLRHTGDQARARLREEARAIARLAHPNVVAVHDVGDADGEVFVAMEHVDGQTLRDWLRTNRSPDEILSIFVQAGRGLTAAHHVGLVHRDFKPSNIMVGKDGRARVLDFGLARAHASGDDGIAGTPAYMAPEQQRGDRVDARADQFAFCVALWEALGGDRPEPGARGELTGGPDRARGELTGVPDRVVRALRRGLAERPEDRFPTLDALLRELAPPQRRGQRWMIATFVAVAGLATVLVLMARSPGETPSCALAGDPISRVWGEPQRTALRTAFAATRLPYAAGAATEAIAHLDAWSTRWQRGAGASCRATVIDRVQPPELHALRQACLDQLLERLTPIVTLATAADPTVVANARALATGLPAPERCDDTAALTALPPLPPAESARTEVSALRAAIATTEAAINAGRGPQLRAEVDAHAKRAESLGYPPLQARALLLVARLDQAAARYDETITALHAAARIATAARDLPQLAEIWIELTQTLGNDVRTLDQADVFDGYATALIALLPDRAELLLQLELARCNRNLDRSKPDNVAKLAGHCEATIAAAERATPPRPAIANAARSRLGHFQRLLGDSDQAIATLTTAVDEAVRVHGPHHPDTAIARYSLGIAEISRDQFDAGVDQLRQALAIRRAAFPTGNLQIAESLQGLGDALATRGDHAAAIPLFREALAMLEAVGQPASAQGSSVHIFLGMSLEETKADDDAITHYLRGADIADRFLQHSEPQAALGLRLAADVLARQGHAATAIPHLERALRLLERGKAAPIQLGQTQQRISELLVTLGPAERPRARAMADAARASYVTAGAPAAPRLEALDAFRRAQRWR